MVSPDTPVLFTACDTGTANYFIPILRQMPQRSYVLLAQQEATAVIKRAGLSYIEIHETEENTLGAACNLHLSHYKPSLVVAGTSWGPTLDKAMTLAARDQRITTIAVIEHWNLYKERFCRLHDNIFSEEMFFLPDQIWVNDTFAKQEAIRAGLPTAILTIMGQPHLENKLLELSQDMPRQQNTSHEIVFISEKIRDHFLEGTSLDVGYNEYKALAFLHEAMDFSHFTLTIKLHPQEATDKYADFLKTLTQTQKNRIQIVKECDINSLIKCAHKIVGMGSMLLLEAALVRSDILSILPDSEPDVFLGNKMGITTFIPTIEKLCEELQKPPVFNTSSFGEKFLGSTKRAIDTINRMTQRTSL